ncbi:MAG: phospho-N-acetylmuramoyl-pentapeptide-transferase [Eubacteriaceae bacterium]|nr:phospho-N-acetylmuramoyl-pentapeptide-transferase [Eubacteriaceae bacterium]
MDKTLIALAASLLMVIFTGPLFIPYLEKLKFGQTIREEGPKSHMAKTGTPTMGGILFIGAASAVTLALSQWDIRLVIIMVSFIGFGLIGFIDDYIKVILKRNLGLRAWQKIVMQLVLAFSVSFMAYSSLEMGASIAVPFTAVSLNLGGFYIPFMIFVILAFVNAVNLTDGLDGLATGVSFFSFLFFLVLSLLFNNATGVIFSAALMGSLLGFLRFNYHPAKVFMGDTGSMALGGAIGALILISSSPLHMVGVGGVFVIEALSVVIQVSYFKLTKGKRVFRMAPIHHHFELMGWKETKVVHRFWLAAAILAVVGILSIL